MPLIFRERQSGVVAYARWRDSTRSQRTQSLGIAWVERHGDRWRNRRGHKPAGALTIDDATVKMRELIEAHEVKLADTSDKNATFKTVAWAWHAHGRDVVGWRPSTVSDRGNTIRTHLLPAFGDRPVRSIDRAEVRKWWTSLHSAKYKRGRKEGRLSDRNCNKLLTELRAIFNWAREDYQLTVNAADGIAKHPERASEKPAFYTIEQVEALVRAAADDQDALAFRVAAYAGLRRGELVSLRWRNIDFARSNLHINESVSAGQDSATKSGKGRTVPLTQTLATALAQARPEDAADDDLVFPGTLPGTKLDGSALRRRFIIARDKAKLPPLRLHDLRHTFGSLAVDGGASLVQVQAWMGHSEIQTTMRYLHTVSRAADAELLDRAFSSSMVESSPV